MPNPRLRNLPEPTRVGKDFIEFSFESLGMNVCDGCSTMLPLWEWAKRDPNVGCQKCRALPSQEDLDGIRREWTPADWGAP